MAYRNYAHKVAAAALAMSRLASAQNPGTNTPEVHPTLPTWKCTTSGGCIQQNTAVVLDWNYRWIHTANGSTSCVNNGQVDSSLCPSEATCSQNCVVEGANYTSSGVSTSGDALTMYQYVKGSTGSYQNASPRLYLLDSNTGNYVDFKLLGQELTFTVDLSTLPCGENGALYLSQMDTTGGRNQYQTGGANYGSGYCDAQCPVQAWKNGTLNTNGGGFCCNEMDILESNSQASAFTPHPCSGGSCDSGGCGFNPYSQGYHNYWGPGMTVDTSKPVTITTQFITNDGTSTGTLAQIKRIYSQNGKALASAVSGGDIITSSWCNTVDSSAASHGGLAQMGQALGQGMVLAFSIWNDNSQYMNWLDSGNSGPCSSSAGNPSTIVSQNPTTHVIFSNIRWGDIGSTTDGTASGGNGSSSSSSSTTTTTDATVPPAATATQTHWGQCGGSYFTGPTVCQAPYTCQTQNPYYAQCL